MSELMKPTRQQTNCVIFKVVTWKDVCIFLEMKVASCTLSLQLILAILFHLKTIHVTPLNRMSNVPVYCMSKPKQNNYEQLQTDVPATKSQILLTKTVSSISS